MYGTTAVGDSSFCLRGVSISNKCTDFTMRSENRSHHMPTVFIVELGTRFVHQ